jgi:MoxR-like ATPase
MRLSVGYPSVADEKILLTHLQREHPVTHLKPVADAGQINDLQRQVWETYVEDSLQDYMIKLVTSTRQHPDLVLGASPRASLALFKAAQALAVVRGRDHVIPDDVQYLVPAILTHRLLIAPEAELRGRTPQSILADITEKTPLEIGKLEG